MLTLYSKEKGIRICRVWFAVEKHDIKNIDVTRYIRIANPDEKTLKQAYVNKAETLLTDLTPEEEDIQSKFRKNYRYEIRRATKEVGDVQFFTAKNITRELLEEFKLVYMNFCETCNNKSLKKAFDEKKIFSYIENDCLMLSRVKFENGRVFHLYVCDDKQACLCYSASEFREEKVNREAAGRANKFLHWRDMLYLKEMGVTSYDWGNVSSFENPNGIDVFKMGFGGEKVILYNILVGCSIKGKLLVKMLRLMGRIRE